MLYYSPMNFCGESVVLPSRDRSGEIWVFIRTEGEDISGEVWPLVVRLGHWYVKYDFIKCHCFLLQFVPYGNSGGFFFFCYSHEHIGSTLHFTIMWQSWGSFYITQYHGPSSGRHVHTPLHSSHYQPQMMSGGHLLSPVQTCSL